MNAYDVVQVHLSISLSRHVPGWTGATDEELFAVAKEIVDALDETPRVVLQHIAEARIIADE